MQSAIELASRGMAVFVIPQFVAALHSRGAKRSCRLVRLPNPPGVGRIYRHAHLICRNDDKDEARTRELAAIAKRTLTAVNALKVPSSE